MQDFVHQPYEPCGGLGALEVGVLLALDVETCKALSSKPVTP